MKKQWFPIKVKTSCHSTLGRWYYQSDGLTGQVFAIGKLRIVLGK
jgi:hypothetical protein